MSDIKHIGITYLATGSIFSSSRGQTALNLANLFQKNYKVTLVHCSVGEPKWWDDAEGLEERYERVSIADISGLDLLVDIDATVSGSIRKNIAKQTVGFLRDRVLFTEMEKDSYFLNTMLRNMENLSGIWIWDILNPVEDMEALKVLLKVPVERVPFVWDPFILDNYMKLAGYTSKKFTFTEEKLNIHIAEKNSTNTSSAIVPLVGLVEASKCIPGRFDKIKVHNATSMKDTPFYKTNIAPNLIFRGKVEVEYTGRERYVDWIEEDNLLVVTHSRFVPVRYGLLDLLYLGIPFVHNSVLLKEYGVSGYYENNSITGFTDAIKNVLAKCEALMPAGKQNVLANWMPERVVASWQPILASTFSWQPKCQESQKETEKKIRIGFVNMWEGFNPGNNFFLDLLKTKCQVEGVEGHDGCSLVVIGPFGDPSNWFEAKCSKVFFSGENVDLPDDPTIDLYLSSEIKEDNRHMRLPIWMLFLKWWNRGLESTNEEIMNPIGLPVDLAIKPHSISFDKRTEVFLQFSKKHKVNSGGQLYNNIGGPLHALYGGGGGGDTAKHLFLEKHKYNICFENSQAPGYVTEKLLHAKMAGCIPIYWGDNACIEDFDPRGFLNFSDYTSIQEIIKKVDSLTPEECKILASTPALDSGREAKARHRLELIAGKLMALIENKKKPDSLPKEQITVPTPIFLSYVSEEYVQSIKYNLDAMMHHRKGLPKLRYIVYLASNVKQETKNKLKERYPWIELVDIDKDFVEPYPEFFNNFGWKLWLLNKVVSDESLKDKLILYTDAGATWLSFPDEFVYKTFKNGLCVMQREDINRQWCSEECINEMKITEDELNRNQIYGGFIGFMGGNELATNIFKEAFTLAQNKNILLGRKFSGFLSNKKPYGHRHDQSILSVLCYRNNISYIDGDVIVCDTTLRLTALEQKKIYLHYGEYAVHKQVLPKVDDVWVVNLDKRIDRYESWAKLYPELADVTHRLPAVEGKKLSLTPNIQKFIEKNDFIWKKAVTGCALSHILLWTQLASEKDPVQSYLILEDDMRFKSNTWNEEFSTIMEALPKDVELAYLGGILPSNKQIYKDVVEPINEIWGIIKPNPFFTADGSLVPIFHFCTYSYYITKSGAQKLLAILNQYGLHTSIDHFLGHPAFGLKKYVLNDLITTCSQEDDPIYQKSEFDNFKRVDTFDSDIWNNVDCFTERFDTLEKQPTLSEVLKDVMNQIPTSIITKTLLGIREELIPIYCSNGIVKTMEFKWLEMLGLKFKLIDFENFIPSSKHVWVLAVAHTDMLAVKKFCSKVSDLGIEFSILHLGDEGELSNIEVYDLNQCKSVIRNYVRPFEFDNKVHVIPLGPAKPVLSDTSKTFTDRNLVWSFHGTNWFNRSKTLEPLKKYEPYDLHFIPSWKHETESSEEKYSKALATSKFVPILRGNNCETFRIYEALEHESIPLYVRVEHDKEYWEWLSKNLSLVDLKTWDDAKKLVEFFLANPEKGEIYRTGLRDQWTKWKSNLSNELKKLV
jgi:GR25 family glycosyltransferase involved in LPS biosynthesis